MIRLVIDVDDNGSWAAYTKEAVAERLTDLGRVRVVSVTVVDKPKQMTMGGRGYETEHNKGGA